ncbi:MAG: hypothetical protein N4A33_02910 [Bacteriovoracaceae bacterium]|jgi:hypothetical protein|nr:hypothetical protein [Bacteriovoracaceae bacterium]
MSLTKEKISSIRHELNGKLNAIEVALGVCSEENVSEEYRADLLKAALEYISKVRDSHSDVYQILEQFSEAS